ncbi:hypothetical protein BDU57DRAFT_545899 [Ampelomyces quisqualis]|uniref:Uncharacterized protein n=1 Tax=Ampelomyces quisqualis TaxID=50730 RepID=A0A6A5QX39_AMPQU|nr:hypothetical protein BDU57DRAFT_545899 [Ampelomyces quisqualis]
MDTSGSYNGNLALATLAADLGLSPTALKTALEDAHDLLQLYGNPNLALLMALTRIGIRIDGQILYAKLSTFRRLFSGILNGATASAAIPQPVTSQLRSNPYRTMGYTPSDQAVLQVQYTPNAMSWQAGRRDTRMMFPPQSTPSPYNSNGGYHNEQRPTRQQSTPAPHHTHDSTAQPLPHDLNNQNHEQATWYQQQLSGDVEGYDNSGSDLLHRFGGII